MFFFLRAPAIASAPQPPSNAAPNPTPLQNHWPTSPASPTVDPVCDPAKKATYDAKQCRLNTWRALVEIWQSGRSKAIGVANYAISDLQEIIDAGMPLPAVNQVPFHLYNAAAQMALLAFCKAHKIVLLSYSPLGIPDWHAFPAQLPARTTLEDPVLLQVAAAHAPATPAQVLLAWLWALGLPSNPRTMSEQHMRDNLAAISAVTLSAAEVQALSTRPLDTCTIDREFGPRATPPSKSPSPRAHKNRAPHTPSPSQTLTADFYECVPSAGAAPPPHPFKRASA